jgi:alkylresorcinol/alkylpyrone synthase
MTTVLLDPTDRFQLERAALSPAIVGSATALPEQCYRQEDIAADVQETLPPEMLRDGMLLRFFETVQVRERHFVLPPREVVRLGGFQERNDLYIAHSLELGERVLRALFDQVDVDPSEVALLATTSVTGIAVPSLDARLMNRIDFDPSLVRMPLFGLGCLGGAAGLARVSEWLRAYPDRCAVLLSVELCSLAFHIDRTIGNLVSTGLFGDGAAAVLVAGAEHPLAARADIGARARVLDSRSVFFPDSEGVMGWEIKDDGFTAVLNSEVPDIVRAHAPGIVDALLAGHDLVREDVAAWVMHPGGPKVIDAMEDSLGLGRGALAPTRQHLAEVGNLSSASVLFVLDDHRRSRTPGDGSYGVLMALGPAFCAEAVLLRFEGGAL